MFARSITLFPPVAKMLFPPPPLLPSYPPPPPLLSLSLIVCQ